MTWVKAGTVSSLYLRTGSIDTTNTNQYNSNSRPSHCPLLDCFHSMEVGSPGPFYYMNDVD